MLPDTKYAKSGDVRVAYQVTGEGPVDLVLAPGTASHLDLDWEWPEKAGFLERLGSFCRLIRFDKRGTGLSDRPTDAATPEERMDDIRAVMDAAGSDRAVVFGYSEGASLAALFASTFPQRTRALLAWGAQARWIRADDYPWGPTREEADQDIAYLAENGVTIEYLTGPGAGIPNDLTYVRFFMRYLKASASPSALAALERMNCLIDMRDILPTVRVPALVMNRTADPVANVEAARDFAARIPGARFVEFPGDAHPFFTGPATGEILAEIETFVTGVRLPPAADRVLATVLFTDIVGSTHKLEAIGDHRWRQLLDSHHARVRQHLQRYGGTEIDTAGDGFFATFNGPTRAIRCACAIRDAVREIGLEIRAGLHTGEIERQGTKATGIAVHIGARVAALAQPGEVLVTSTVKQLVTGSEIHFAGRGAHPLKGVSRTAKLAMPAAYGAPPTFTAASARLSAAAGGDAVWASPGMRPSSGQGQGDGVQGQPHAGSDHRAVDADVLQIGPEEQFQLARCLRRVPPLDRPGDEVGELVVELVGKCPGARFDHPLEAFLQAGV